MDCFYLVVWVGVFLVCGFHLFLNIVSPYSFSALLGLRPIFFTLSDFFSSTLSTFSYSVLAS